MTPSDRSAAQSALSVGRATYARLDQIRGPEDTAADLLELWSAAETAMRAMLGGSSLSGQALVREIRQRGLIGLDQANALVSFADATARVDSVNYKPTLTDVGYARVGYNELVRAVEQPIGQPTGAEPSSTSGVSGDTHALHTAVPSGDASNSGTASYAAAAMNTPLPSGATGKKTGRYLVALLALIVVVVGVGAYLLFGRSSYDREMAQAIETMQAGQNGAARARFLGLVSEYPDKADPHVFLSRLSRVDGDLTTARKELMTAIELERDNSIALREMGMLFLAENNPEMARRFFVHALEVNTKDLAAQGYLGCALIRLNRTDEGQRFLERAGTGDWSSCAAAAVPAR